jgi:RNA polymerase sigma-70 factor (ECF subfamily)
MVMVETATAVKFTPPVPEASPADDGLLVRAAANGDRDAFEALYRRHGGRIVTLCRRMAGSAAVGDELAQEAFVRAWRALPTFGRRSAFGTWLHRIAVNVCLDHQRSGGRHTEVGLEELPAHPSGRTSHPGVTVDLETAIAALPAAARRAFVMHDVEGLRHREIAEITGMAVGTSKANLHRARRLLREALS